MVANTTMSIEKAFDHNSFRGEILRPDFLRSVVEAGNLALNVRQEGLTSEVKSTKEDIVTRGDLAVSSMLRERLSQLFPGIVFIDEEVPESDSLDITAHAMVAIIDPIDGTTNYYNKGEKDSSEAPANPNWAVSVGITREGKLHAGVIYQPMLQKLFYAERGRGAYMNGKRLHVSTTQSLSDARLIYDYPYPKDKKEYELTGRVLAALEPQITSAERLGSAVVETMEVAEGKSDFFMLLRTQPWDVAAAAVIVEEAGGTAFNATGEPFKIGNRSIVLTNGKIEIAPLIHLIYQKLGSDS